MSAAYATNRADYEAGCVLDGRAYFLAWSVRDLGPALYWSRARGCDQLTVLADRPLAGELARRAGHLSGSFRVEVMEVVTADREFTVDVAAPSPLVPPPPLDDDVVAFTPIIAETGARPVDDFGRLIAEVAGLEVARVVDDDTAAIPTLEGGYRLEVGVGLADRELHSFVHGRLDDDTNLRQVIGSVIEHRRVGAGSHPLTRIGRHRWLRSQLVSDPSPVGAVDLVPVPPLRPSATVLNEAPAAGVCAATSTVVVCQVGVDLDLIPEALDYRHRHGDDHRLVLVVPERDRALAARHLPAMIGEAEQARVEVVCPPLPWSTTA